MGKLTTHVLDTAHGCPAAGMALELFRLPDTPDVPTARQQLYSGRTNADGRCDQPLLADEALLTGGYELCFEVADYFAAYPESPAEPFLRQVTLRFYVSDADKHYHVPLLVSPWAYSTYRGS